MRASAYVRPADVAGATATRVRCGAGAVNVDMRSPFGSRSPSLHRRRYSTSGRVSTAPLLGLRDDPDVRPGGLPLAECLLRLVVRDRARDDHLVALLPLGGGRDLVLRGQLQRVDDA